MKFKRICILLLAAVMIFSMASCNNNQNPPDENPGGNPGGSTGDNPNNNTNESGSENTINVYFIIGQSNAVGYGQDTAKLVENSDDRFTDGFDNVLYYGSQERWNGAYPDKFFEPVTLGMGVASDRSGAEIGIASAIADEGEMNAIIKCAWGATHLYPDTQYDISKQQGTWTSPTYIKNNNVDISENPMIGNMYNRFEETAKKGIQLLIEDGYTPVIKGVWWMQGEAEMFTYEMSSAYRELFKTLIYDTRNMLSEVTGYDCTNVPFVAGLPKWNTKNSPAPAYQSTVRNAITTVVNELNNVGCVDCMPLNQHDDWHFDAQGQKYLGEKFIAKVQDFEANDETLEGDRVRVDNEVKLLIDEVGLEFRADLTGYNSEDGNEYGFLIVPTSELEKSAVEGDYINSLEELYINYQNIPAEVTVERIDDQYSDIYFTCKLTNTAYENLNTAYTAIAYIKNAYGSYSYSSRYVSASVGRLASELLYTDAENKDAIMTLVNNSVNFFDGIPYEDRNNENRLKLTCEENVVITFSQASAGYPLVIERTLPDLDLFMRFTSKNPEIASVDANGVVTPHKVGETVILVECAGKTKEIKITVDGINRDGVQLDGVISSGEYVGQVINKSNGTGVSAKIIGMIKNGSLYMAFELTHGEWSPYSSQWWVNDSIEIKLNNGASHTVVFYEGVPTYSDNISYGVSVTEKSGTKYVTTVEICIENITTARQLRIGLNGANFGWLGAIWSDDYNYGFITSDGIIINAPVNVGNGIVLDGNLNEGAYTTNVKNSSIKGTANGAQVEIIGTLTEGGVLYGVTVNHTKAPDVSTDGTNKWWTYMGIEFHFNGTNAQYMFLANNHTSIGNMFGYCKTVQTSGGYTSTFEIFIPYEAIGVAADVGSLSFTARGWFETGWCDLLNTTWAATHKVTSNGISKL